MLTHGFHPVDAWLTSEPAVHRDAKVCKKPRCCCMSPLQTRRAVDWQHDSKIHARSVDLEIGRINGVVSQIEEVSDRVSSTARSAQEMVEAPAAAVSGLADGVHRFFSVLFRG